VQGLRRALLGRDTHTTLEVLLEKMRKTPSNAAFLQQIHQTVPGA
jgi:transcription termination factor Rho